MAPEHTEPEEISLTQMTVLLWSRRWWIVASTILFATIFVATAFLMRPIYRAETMMVSATVDRSSIEALNSATAQLGIVASFGGFGAGTSDFRSYEAMLLLRSRQFTERFLLEKNLSARLYEESRNRFKVDWPILRMRHSIQFDAYRYFSDKVEKLSRNSQTGLVTLRIDWTDRIEAAEWSGELVRRINAEMRKRAVLQAEASIGFLQEELRDTLDVGVRTTISRLIEVQLGRRALATVSREYAFTVVDTAMTPDERDEVRPLKLLLLLLGPTLGFMVGCAGVLFDAACDRLRVSNSSNGV